MRTQSANRNRSAATAFDVPRNVATRTCTRPAAWAGVVTFSEVAERTFTLRPALVPKRTEVTPVRWRPVIVTRVPPVVGPDPADSRVTAGAAFGAALATGATTARRPTPRRSESRSVPIFEYTGHSC